MKFSESLDWDKNRQNFNILIWYLTIIYLLQFYIFQENENECQETEFIYISFLWNSISFSWYSTNFPEIYK